MANKPKDGKSSKEKPAKDSGGGGGSKQKKKKWSKGKTRDKLNNLILFDKATYDKFLKEVPSYKLITPSVVSERLKIRASLAKAALKELAAKNIIRAVIRHSKQDIYTKMHDDKEDEKTPAEKPEKPTKAEKAEKAEKADKQ